MIHVERYDTDSEAILGFRIEVDGLSDTDYYELDQQAARLAIDRYLNHREQLYTDPPAELDGTISWLIHGLGRNHRLWEDFHVYFLLAKLRIILSDEPQPVDCAATVDHLVDSALAELCEEYDVQYRPGSRSTTVNEHDPQLRSGLNTFNSWLRSQLSAAFASLQLWLIFFMLIIVRPIILKIYNTACASAEVRVWLNAFKDHRHRFFDAPSDLTSQGRQVRYAVYDEVALSSVKAFIWRSLGNLRRVFDPEEPIHVEWYATPAAFRQAIKVAPRLRDEIQRVAAQARDKDDSPEFTYFTKQLETISTKVIFQVLFMEAAIEGFADKVDDDTWVYARPPTKALPRVMALVGDREDITTVSVAPHYYSETRVSSRFTDHEVNGSVALPDLNVVFEPSSAKTYQEQGLPSTQIAVACDKVEAESGVIKEGNTSRDHLESTAHSSISPPDSSPIRVLILLNHPLDNREFVNAVESATRDLSNIKLIFKPHPFYPPDDSLFDGFQNAAFEVTAPDTSLADLVKTCDICITIYSTAAFPALVQAIPVVWLPFASQKHIYMDLIGDIGIQANDPENLANILDRLVHDKTFYVKQAQKCKRFAESELVPNADAPSLADLLDETV